MKKRCPWVPLDKPLYVQYHDEDWGVPVYDDRLLFAKLCLDGAQAGLSWWSILQRQENYYTAFDNFEAEKIAAYDDARIAELLQNPGIIRNRLKVQSVVKNARGFLKIQEELGSFSNYLWAFVGGKTIPNRLEQIEDNPATSPESEAMSKDLRKRGFTFVGPTICYAFMQAVGMVNDHSLDCFRRNQV